tara:strand:+ start:155 stop:466 length:312 start_codon:yes stop_codon:yes gene_type:complete
MFCVVYSFHVIKGKEAFFENSWKELTDIIYAHANSNGSRLHKSKGNEYIAYASWPNKKTWEEGRSKLPRGSEVIGEKMKDCCTNIQTVYELDMVNDLLKNEQK